MLPLPRSLLLLSLHLVVLLVHVVVVTPFSPSPSSFIDYSKSTGNIFFTRCVTTRRRLLPIAQRFIPSLLTTSMSAASSSSSSSSPSPTSSSPKHTNRLVHEKSLYLQQHAHNPVDWYPWGEEAFARAKELNRPILLSVG